MEHSRCSMQSCLCFEEGGMMTILMLAHHKQTSHFPIYSPLQAFQRGSIKLQGVGDGMGNGIRLHPYLRMSVCA